MHRSSAQFATGIAAALVMGPAALAQSQEPLTLKFSQRGGERSVEVQNENGRPGDIYFTAMSLNEENNILPGAGWWFGLHIPASQLIDQALAGAPFAGFLDSEGDSFYGMPAGTLHPAVPTIYSVTTTFAPDLLSITGVSNLTNMTPMPAPIITTQPVLSADSVTPAAPLVRTLSVETDIPTQVELIIDDGHGAARSVIASPDFATSHVDVPVLGYCPDSQVVVSVIVRNVNGTPTQAAQDLIFQTDPLPAEFPPIEITILPDESETVEPGVTLFTIWEFGQPSRSWLVMLNENGEVVWYFDGQQNALTMNRNFNIEPLRNGNVMLMAGNVVLVEINRLGEVEGAWWAANLATPEPGTLPVPVDTFHHEFIELPEGQDADFMILGTELRQYPNYPADEVDPTQTVPVGNVIGDTIVEFNRDGTIVRSQGFLDSLDPYRVSYSSLGTFWDRRYAAIAATADWSHGNGVVIDWSDNSYITSLRAQDALVKTDRLTGELKWILGDPARWNAPWSDKLLAPMPGLEWQYHQHAPEITADGNLLIFDNGNNRAIPPAARMPFDASYSRAVEFSIDENAMTVEQAWVYGGPTDPSHNFYSFFISDANRMPATGNVLVTDGGSSDVQGGPRFARIVEVTHTTPPVEIYEILVKDQSPVDTKSFGTYRSYRIPGVYPE